MSEAPCPEALPSNFLHWQRAKSVNKEKKTIKHPWQRVERKWERNNINYNDSDSSCNSGKLGQLGPIRETSNVTWVILTRLVGFNTRNERWFGGNQWSEELSRNVAKAATLLLRVEHISSRLGQTWHLKCHETTTKVKSEFRKGKINCQREIWIFTMVFFISSDSALETWVNLSPLVLTILPSR